MGYHPHCHVFAHLRTSRARNCIGVNIVKLLRATPGSSIVGTQTGSLDAGELILKPPFCNPGEHKTIYRHSKETMKDLFEKATKVVGLTVNVWTEYDEDDVKRRAEGQKQTGEEWEQKARFFAGERERRIFFRVEVI
ncbi:hypothetical protein GGR54DRAFT_592098 [Hypoxylon sp. NC1633]|nr:hypothetical protein GGR54DRAFT_592098 [Hypoxylon sp. NC1633]